ncbi:MAG: hypothetical protein LBS88_04155, partial [Tannerellaceae bacterium]|jgi:hypothetical protein|nr:hypothetical protein [Tannerellaceae bacterium]
MKELKKFFEGIAHPSVRLFRERIVGLPPEEQREYFHRAFDCTLHGFDTYSGRFQSFFHHLVRAYSQEYLDYLHEKTLLGRLRYPLHDGDLFRKIVYLTEGSCRRAEGSGKELAFALLLSFGYDLKISTLHQYMRTERLDTVDIAELLEEIYLV